MNSGAYQEYYQIISLYKHSDVQDQYCLVAYYLLDHEDNSSSAFVIFEMAASQSFGFLCFLTKNFNKGACIIIPNSTTPNTML